MTDEKLALTDVETTGLRPEDGHLLLEIAVLPASPVYPFTPLTDTPFHAVILHPRDLAYFKADDYVRKMHTRSGLWDKLEHGTPIQEVDAALLAYLKQFADQPLELRVAGNSVRLDMNFLDAYLPLSAAFLNYRFLDISGLAFYAHMNHQVPYYLKKLAHTAGDDIIESLAELVHTHEGIVAALQPVQPAAPTRPREESCNFEHLKEDLNNALVWVMGPNYARNVSTVETILDGFTGYGEASDMLLSVKTLLNTHIFAQVLRYSIEHRTSLRYPAQQLVTSKSLRELGMTLSDLGWTETQRDRA